MVIHIYYYHHLTRNTLNLLVSFMVESSNTFKTRLQADDMRMSTKPEELSMAPRHTGVESYRCGREHSQADK